jgi:hypothetical protein
MTVPAPVNYRDATVIPPPEQTNGALQQVAPYYRAGVLEDAAGDVGDGAQIGLVPEKGAPNADLPGGTAITGPNTFDIYLKVVPVPVRIIATFDDGLGGTPYDENYEMGPSTMHLAIDVAVDEVLRGIAAERLFWPY